MRIAFIPPSLPVVKPEPPAGDRWRHEVKFDGFRAQLHTGREPIIYSKNGADFSARFRHLLPALEALPPAVIDAELVACDPEDRPDFRALLGGSRDLCLWAFDLLHDGKDIRALPWSERRARLRAMLTEQGSIRFSEDFGDPVALLKAAGEMHLEGIVSKRVDQPYRSGHRGGWIKVKLAAWREANRWRHEMFQR